MCIHHTFILKGIIASNMSEFKLYFRPLNLSVEGSGWGGSRSVLKIEHGHPCNIDSSWTVLGLQNRELLELQWKDFWVRLIEKSEDMLESTDIYPNILLDRTLIRMGGEYTHANIISSKADSALWAELWSEISILLPDEQTNTGIAECIKYERDTVEQGFLARESTKLNPLSHQL